ILRSYKLGAGTLQINLSSSQTWKDQGLLPGDQVRSIEFRRYVHSQITAPQRVAGVFGVGSRRKKVAAKRKEDPSFTGVHRRNRLDCVVAVVARWLETEFVSKFLKEGVRRPLPDPHCAIALNVAVPSHRTESGAAFANLPAAQHQVHNLLNVADRILVLSQAHGPTKDCSL